MEITRSRRKPPVLQLDPEERDLMHELLGEMRTLLEAELPREDEVTRRLFPDAFEDPDRSQEFRELVGDELRASKLAAVDALDENLASDGPAQLVLEAGKVHSLLAVLTDMRLAIGTRLGVTEEAMATAPDPSDPEIAAWSVLHWLGWIQESVLSAITR
jgi:Domain of unknown function (DUF2017)